MLNYGWYEKVYDIIINPLILCCMSHLRLTSKTYTKEASKLSWNFKGCMAIISICSKPKEKHGELFYRGSSFLNIQIPSRLCWFYPNFSWIKLKINQIFANILKTSLTISSEYVWDEIQQICHALSICHFCMQIYNTHSF